MTEVVPSAKLDRARKLMEEGDSEFRRGLTEPPRQTPRQVDPGSPGGGAERALPPTPPELFGDASPDVSPYGIAAGGTAPPPPAMTPTGGNLAPVVRPASPATTNQPPRVGNPDPEAQASDKNRPPSIKEVTEAELKLEGIGVGYGGLVREVALFSVIDPERQVAKARQTVVKRGKDLLPDVEAYREAKDNPGRQEVILEGILSRTKLGAVHRDELSLQPKERSYTHQYNQAKKRLRKIYEKAASLDEPGLQGLAKAIDDYNAAAEAHVSLKKNFEEAPRWRRVIKEEVIDLAALPGRLIASRLAMWRLKSMPGNPEKVSKWRTRVHIGVVAAAGAFGAWQLARGIGGAGDIASIDPSSSPEVAQSVPPSTGHTVPPEMTPTTPEAEPTSPEPAPSPGSEGLPDDGDSSEPHPHPDELPGPGDEPESEVPAEIDLTINHGDGWYKFLDEWNIDRQFLQDYGPQLQELGLAYWDDNHSNWGLNYGNGEFSQEDYDWIIDKAEEAGLLEGAEPSISEAEPNEDVIVTEPTESYLDETGETRINETTKYKEGTIYHGTGLAMHGEAANYGIEVDFAQLQQNPEFRNFYHNETVQSVLDRNGYTWETAETKYHKGDTLEILRSTVDEFMAKVAELTGQELGEPEATTASGPTALISNIEAYDGQGNGAVFNQIFHNDHNVPGFVQYMVDHPDQISGLYPDMTIADLMHYTQTYLDIPPAPRVYHNGREYIDLAFVQGAQELMARFLNERHAGTQDEYALAA